MSARERGPVRWVVWATVGLIVAVAVVLGARAWNDRRWDSRIASGFGSDPEEIVTLLKRDFPEDYRRLRQALMAEWRAGRRSEPELHAAGDAWGREFSDRHWDEVLKAPPEYLERFMKEGAAVQRSWASADPGNCVHVLTRGEEGASSTADGAAPDRSFRLVMQAAKAGKDSPVAHGRATSVDLAAFEQSAADPALWRAVSAGVPGSDLAGSNAHRCAQLLVRFQALADQPPDRLARLMQGQGPQMRYLELPSPPGAGTPP